uniref:baculoviral IAP repeat-containing protein 7-A-like isoform X3 n=1 Tax=Myxine glutinosa TaxID=7769 RepID=UPI00358E6D97
MAVVPPEDLSQEIYRLGRFVNCTEKSPVFIRKLARAGFYPTGVRDTVKCFSCGCEIGNLKDTDEILERHKQASPRCSYVSGGAGRVQSGADDLHLGIHQPHSPDKQQFDVRFSTFVSWPNKANISASCLASAGFYYTGIADNVKCFFCDGGLRNWEMGDDPWHEHTKWFPRCGFVLQEKGQAYVRTVQSSYPNLMQVLSQANSAANTGRDQSTRHQATTCMDQQGQLMKSTLVKCVLEMGFDRNIVQSTIHSKFLLTGSVYTQLDELINDIIAAEEDVHIADHQNDKAEQSLADAQARTSKTNDYPSSTEEELRRLQDERMCKVCMDKEVSVVFIPCGHLVVCFDCASSPSLRKCPICRSVVRGTLRTYMS